LLLGSAAALLLPLEFMTQLVVEDEHEELLARPGHLSMWDGEKQVVYAYQRGAEKGEPCLQLEAVSVELPVKLMWHMPPDWVKTFPAIHFQTSSGQWAVYEGWQGKEAFLADYATYNPPPKTTKQASPFKGFVQKYWAPQWTWPGLITDHLLDPNGPHRFSEYELRGLKTSEKKRLHTAHHNGLVEPGKRPPAM
jgi:hypothetical protein